jgi:hypothetical protein
MFFVGYAEEEGVSESEVISSHLQTLFVMQLRLFGQFTREWVEVAPFLVGEILGPIVRTLPGDRSLEESSRIPGAIPVDPYGHLVRLCQEFRTASEDLQQAEESYDAAATGAFSARATLQARLACPFRSFSATEFRQQSESLDIALAALSNFVVPHSQAFVAWVKAYARLAEAFGKGAELTEDSLARLGMSQFRFVLGRYTSNVGRFLVR